MELDRLYNMDCIKGMNQIEPGTIDLAFADPPFNIGYKYDVYEDQRTANEYLDWSKQWGAALVRALTPTGTFWLAIGDDFAAELKMIFQRELGLHCRSWVIWYYTFGVHCKNKFARSHTHLFHFVKDVKNFTFNATAIRVPSARQLVYADSRANDAGRLPDDTWILRPQNAPGSFTAKEDVWYVPRVCGTFKERAGWHGCQMPEQLLGRIIKTCSNPGERVLDPFGGSGTTLVVAKKLDRRFVGFELSENYAQQIESRLAVAKLGDALLGLENPLLTASTKKEGRRPRNITPKTKKISATASETSDLNSPIRDAFLAIRQGYPVDRVIADPEFNADFLAKCRKMGLPGSEYDWNHRLMNLRKAGFLKGLPPAKPTVFEFEHKEFDRYRFACEIAVQHFEQGGNATLDHILCDPRLARGFDEYVLAMLPDQPNSLKIRWFALRIRKEANRISRASVALAEKIAKTRDFDDPFGLAWATIPTDPGLYWLWENKRHLYVGETENLRERLEIQFSKQVKFNFWGTSRSHLRLSFKPVTGPATGSLRRQQSRWIHDWEPIGNYEKLAARI